MYKSKRSERSDDVLDHGNKTPTILIETCMQRAPCTFHAKGHAILIRAQMCVKMSHLKFCL